MINVFILTLFSIGTLSDCYYFEDNRPRYLTAGVGDSVVFDCEVDFPLDYPIPYKLYWKHKVTNIFVNVYYTTLKT